MIRQKKDSEYEVIPRYWVDNKEVLRVFQNKRIANDVLFCFRNTCRPNTDIRTAKGTLIPASAVSNGAPIMLLRGNSEDRIVMTIAFACLFSSLVFDYLVRQKTSSGNLNRFIVIQIAVPSPENLKRIFEFRSETKTARDWVIQNSIPLFFTTTAFAEFFNALGMESPEMWDKTKRFENQCFLDALIAKLYGLTEEEFAHVLDGFPKLSSKERRETGEFKTKLRCLNYFNLIKEVGNDKKALSTPTPQIGRQD